MTGLKNLQTELNYLVTTVYFLKSHAEWINSNHVRSTREGNVFTGVYH